MKHKIEIFSAGCKTCKDTIEVTFDTYGHLFRRARRA
jgi:hypothetical protein